MTINQKLQKYIWLIILIFLIIFLWIGFKNNIFEYNKVIILEDYETRYYD
jgi:hypothetical protein